MENENPDDLTDAIEDWLAKNKVEVDEIAEKWTAEGSSYLEPEKENVPKRRLKCHNCLRHHLTSNLNCPFCGTKYLS